MKAFLAAVIAAVVIAVGAGVILDSINQTAGEAYSTDNVRLN